MGTCRPALPRRSRRHAKRARDVGSIWPCPEGIRQRGGGGDGLSKIDRPRPELRRRASATWACLETSGADRRGSWRIFLFVGSRSGAAPPAGRADRARLVGGEHRTAAARGARYGAPTRFMLNATFVNVTANKLSTSGATCSKPRC